MPYLKTLAMSFRSSEDATQVYYGMLLHEGRLYESKKAKLHVITDQIGTGDAFCAGLTVWPIVYPDRKLLIGQ
jgi:2-dehydro-3-deoxygluconokinase